MKVKFLRVRRRAGQGMKGDLRYKRVWRNEVRGWKGPWADSACKRMCAEVAGGAGTGARLGLRGMPAATPGTASRVPTFPSTAGPGLAHPGQAHLRGPGGAHPACPCPHPQVPRLVGWVSTGGMGSSLCRETGPAGPCFLTAASKLWARQGEQHACWLSRLRAPSELVHPRSHKAGDSLSSTSSACTTRRRCLPATPKAPRHCPRLPAHLDCRPGL